MRCTMPIDDDARVAITLRLQTAYAETLESYTRKPAWIELLRDVALALPCPDKSG